MRQDYGKELHSSLHSACRREAFVRRSGGDGNLFIYGPVKTVNVRVAGVDSNISGAMLEEFDENLAMLCLFVGRVAACGILRGSAASRMASP